MATNTLATLKPLCAAYHKMTSNDLTVNSIDLFLVAANNARRNAEMRHNFEFSRVRGTLSIDGVSGGSLADVVLSGSTITAIEVTGTLNPNATGTYVLTGKLNGYNFYTNIDGDGGFFLYHDGATAWHIYDFASGTGGANHWDRSSTSQSPVGTYTAAGTATGTATVAAAATGPFQSFKEVVTVTRLRDDGSDNPLDFTRHDIAVERERTELEFDDDNRGAWRWPSDAQIEARTGHPNVVQRGQELFIYPTDAEISEDISLTLYGYGWLKDYETTNLSDSTPTDFLIRYGFQYMQWAIINELNFYFKTFVPREEGNLTAPQQEEEVAWRKLLLWDTYQVDSNLTRSR